MEKVSVRKANASLAAGEALLIDVREYSEFTGEHVENARLLPLSNFERFIPQLDRSKPILIMCRSGKRATQAAGKLAAQGFPQVAAIEGGMEEWKKANLPVVTGESKVWSLERQVRFAAGSLVLAGIALSFIVHPYFIALSAFVGAGLMFAAITDTCGMAMVLAKMPWNQAPGAAQKV